MSTQDQIVAFLSKIQNLLRQESNWIRNTEQRTTDNQDRPVPDTSFRATRFCIHSAVFRTHHYFVYSDQTIMKIVSKKISVKIRMLFGESISGFETNTKYTHKQFMEVLDILIEEEKCTD